ncbi:MAG: hypothetical protein K9M11_04135 [Candidatus Pacebacteria bacterium]|nr:hypothetical protein [Candidatus Paceibacterota bacterium]
MNLFKLKTKIRRSLNQKLKFEHPSSAPFLSGDTFRSICNHAYDEFSDIDPHQVQQSDIVFVKNNFLKDFFVEIHPEIKNQYILLSHNDDTTIDESFLPFVDEKIIHWFGVNINVEHPKMTPLPIGLENMSYRRNGLLKYFDKKEMSNKKSQEKYIISAINIEKHTNKERIFAVEQAKKNSLVTTILAMSNHQEYIDTIQQYKFIISPRGEGIDCHRTWEALYLGLFPIVTECPNTNSFVRAGIPLFPLKSWENIGSVNQTELVDFYNKNMDKLNHPAAFIDYWIDLIHKKRV